jgi:activator of HSP90 ATPase|eukprot:gnl/Ergobibamus_cyprinoides/2066.p2 GENE.gnl/Ergobibamus_cyprinoides/2066~~gnl/Ergobibamus_cyprinoides/2066.p2  ORF type:complete len:152 (+),score=71.64 gnl/Ergobibamus_cyprinoides/2066:695-1150(+)
MAVPSHSVWNQNGFLWEEMNLSAAFKEEAAKRVAALQLPYEDFELAAAVSKHTGNVKAYNRKGKLLVAFELQIEVTLTGAAPDGTEHKATLSYPDVCSAEEPAEWEVDVAVKEPVKALPAHKVLRQHVAKAIEPRVRAVFSDLIAEYRRRE